MPSCIVSKATKERITLYYIYPPLDSNEKRKKKEIKAQCGTRTNTPILEHPNRRYQSIVPEGKWNKSKRNRYPTAMMLCSGDTLPSIVTLSTHPSSLTGVTTFFFSSFDSGLVGNRHDLSHNTEISNLNGSRSLCSGTISDWGVA